MHAGLDVQHGDAVGVTVAVDGQGLQIAAPGVPDVGLAVADEVVLAQGAEGTVGDDEVQAGDQKEKRSQKRRKLFFHVRFLLISPCPTG